MKLVKLPRYVQHSAYRVANPVNGTPAVRAMRRGPTAVVDANAFLHAEPMFTDAVYPDEEGGDALVTAWFGKGCASFNIETRASELARVLGRGSLPDEWFGR